MATYAISDIHGYYDKFMDMLKLINFTNTDVMYILGDIIDRGTDSLKLLHYIGSQENMHYMKGNHEELFVHSDVEFKSWYRNGGAAFNAELIQAKMDRDVLREWFKDLPMLLKVQVGQNTFYLAHAGLIIEDGVVAENQVYNYVLWHRKNSRDDYKLSANTYAVFGHTPTQDICRDTLGYTGAAITNNILRLNSAFFIDGKVYSPRKGQLNCLRLDDFAEFTIRNYESNEGTENRGLPTKVYTPLRRSK